MVFIAVETEFENVTLDTVTVSISPSTTYYNMYVGSRLYITCYANCNPQCRYQWYHANYKSDGRTLEIQSMTTDLDYRKHGPLLCLASNDEVGPFSSPEIRIYVHEEQHCE